MQEKDKNFLDVSEGIDAFKDNRIVDASNEKWEVGCFSSIEFICLGEKY